MRTIHYTDAKDQLLGLMDAASNDREPIVITRPGSGNVVMMAMEEYEAMESTLHLYTTRSNAEQIQQSLEDYAKGNIKSGDLCD